MRWKGEMIARVLLIAMGGGLVRMFIRLGTQVPEADLVFLACVMAGGALSLYLVGALVNAWSAAAGWPWSWCGVTGAAGALIAQSFVTLFGHAPAFWGLLLLTALLWGGLGGVGGLPFAGGEALDAKEEHESA